MMYICISDARTAATKAANSHAIKQARGDGANGATTTLQRYQHPIEDVMAVSMQLNIDECEDS